MNITELIQHSDDQEIIKGEWGLWIISGFMLAKSRVISINLNIPVIHNINLFKVFLLQGL